jgi:hypothetical protein
MDFEYSEALRRSITAMGGVAVVVALKVPWAYFTTQGISPRRVFHHAGYFTTQGISPRRDVDYSFLLHLVLAEESC